MSLLSPYYFEKIGITTKNRIAMAAMTNKQSQDSGLVSNDEISWLMERAKNNFGLITTCASHICESGKGWSNEMGVFSDEFIPKLSELGEKLALTGSLSIMQIFHGGIRSYGVSNPNSIVGPSPYMIQWNQKPILTKEINEDEIYSIIEKFSLGAKRAYKSGFHGVEIHGAHGYLITQFLSKKYNKRKDSWGDSLENRAKFLFSIVSEIRKKVPKTFVVGLRLSPESYGIDFSETLNLLSELSKKELDYIHISLPQFDKYPEDFIPSNKKSILELCRKEVTPSIPLFVAGNIQTKEDGEKALKLGADIIAIARMAIGNPDWPIRVARDNNPPKLPPYSEEYLKNCKLNSEFITYMKSWQGFVKKS